MEADRAFGGGALGVFCLPPAAATFSIKSHHH
jgi:hypothetical protein